MTVVALPVQYGPKAPPKVFRRVRYLRAVPAVVVALPVDTKARAYNLYLAGSEIDETDIPAGLALYEQAIALDPQLSIALTNLGNCHHRLGRSDLARRCYESALEISPTQPEALYNLGYLLLCNSNLDRAIPMFEAALAEDPLMADAWFNLGLAYEQRLGTIRSPRVRRCFERFLRCAPQGDDWIEIARRHIG